jgi:hypothetical protein
MECRRTGQNMAPVPAGIMPAPIPPLLEHAPMNASWTLDLFPARWRARYDRDFRRTLNTHPASIADTVDLVLGAGAAHLRQDRGPREAGRDHKPFPGRSEFPREHPLWMVALWSHLSLFIAVNMVLVIINLLATPGTIWFPYALWGWGIALAVHIGITWPGREWLQANALVTGVVSAGLIGIDMAQGGDAWSVWPIWALVSVLAVHALWATNRVGDFGAHLLLVMFAGLELAGVAIFQRDGDLFREFTITLGYFLATVVVHGMYRFGNPTLLQAHAVLFALIGGLLVADSLTVDGARWFVYPLMGWSVLLGAHALLSRRLSRTPEGAWESSMLEALEQGSDASPEGAAARVRSRRRGFRAHLVVFGIGAATLGVLNLLSMDTGWWIVWPLSIWLVLLAAHAGMLLISRYPNLGLWIGGGAAASAWIYVLDRSTGGGPWWFWPVGVWAVLTPIIASLNIDLLALVASNESEPERRSDRSASGRA